jgi:hypothetical protein
VSRRAYILHEPSRAFAVAAVLFVCACNEIPDGQAAAEKPRRVFLVSDTGQADGVAFFVHADTDTLLVVQRNDTVFRFHGPTNGLTVRDLDEDGNDDIILHHVTNVPGIEEVVRYSSQRGRFVEVVGFTSFPASEQIEGTGLFYSYHRSGCADLNWDSDLFYLQDTAAVRIGNMHGEGCEDVSVPMIRVSKFPDALVPERSVQVDSMTFDPTCSGSQSKWGIIEEYWTSNWRTFGPAHQ